MDYKNFYILKGNAGYDKRITKYFIKESSDSMGYLAVFNTIEEAKNFIDLNYNFLNECLK